MKLLVVHGANLLDDTQMSDQQFQVCIYLLYIQFYDYSDTKVFLLIQFPGSFYDFEGVLDVCDTLYMNVPKRNLCGIDLDFESPLCQKGRA